MNIRLNKSKVSVVSLGVVAMLCVAMAFQHPLSFAGPGESVGMGTASSMPRARTPQGTTINNGDGSVASRTGAYDYSFPVVVPPGRLGVQPSLSLNYNSQGSLYGGVASQWSMGIPEIRVDYSDGQLAAPNTSNGELPWKSDLSGGHRLVPVVETSQPGTDAYRAEYDDNFIRYEKFPDLVSGDTGPQWIARTLDGNVSSFGDPSHILDDTNQPTHLVDSAPLTRVEDKYGNAVDYYWRTTAPQGNAEIYQPPASYDIERIEYTKNASVAGGLHFAEVVFDYGNRVYCDGSAMAVGGASSHKGSAMRIAGERPLNNIVMSVADEPGDSMREVRRVHLEFNDSPCTPNLSPIRQLVSLTETGTDPAGTSTSFNPITFTYGPTARPFDQLGVFDIRGPAGSPIAKHLSRGRRDATHPLLNTTEAMLIDLDGDGRLDRIFSDYENAYSGPARNASLSGSDMDGCGMVWLRNEGDKWSQDAISPVSGSSSVPIKLPRINWSDGEGAPDGDRDELCSLTGQVTVVRNKTTPAPVLCTESTSSTRLVYNFMDIDSDGLPDLVTGLYYNDSLYDPANDSSYPFPRVTVADGSVEDTVPTDELFSAECDNPLRARQVGATESMYALHWYRNQGPEAGFFDLKSPTFMPSPIPLPPNVGASQALPPQGTLQVSFGASAFRDIDGDGYLDAIWSDGENNSRVVSGGLPPSHDFPTTIWSVRLGDGLGGFHQPPSGTLPYPWLVPEGASVSSELQGFTDFEGLSQSITELKDVNADGLVDLIHWYSEFPEVLYGVSYNDFGSSRIYINNGLGFREEIDPTKPPLNHISSAPPLVSDADRPDSTGSMSVYLGIDSGGTSFYGNFEIADGESRVRFSDFDSDGRPDLFSQQDVWAPNNAPFVPPFTGPTNPRLYINSGLGTLLTPEVGSSSPIASGSRFMDHRTDLFFDGWSVFADFIDLNGDGEPENVTTQANSTDVILFYGRATVDGHWFPEDSDPCGRHGDARA